MNNLEIPPSELLKRVNDLRKLGYTVTLEKDQKGLFLKIIKKDLR